MKTTLMALAASCAVLAATPAIAGEQITIKHSDLNLATPQGQQALERRIDAAAKKVCGLDTVMTGTRIKSREAQRCYKQAQTDAQAHFAALVKNQQLGG